MKRNKRYYPIDEEVFKKEIEPRIVRQHKRTGRPCKISHYTFFCAVLYVLRTGIPWRDVPECYGDWHTIYTRFHRWSNNGVFWRLLYELQESKKICIKIARVDSSTVPLHRHGSGALKSKGPQAIGRGKKGMSTKMHCALSPEGLLHEDLSAGQVPDVKVFADFSKH